MNVYVINLDKNTDRLQSVSKRLLALDVPFVRISAVNGKGLSAEERKRLVSSFKWWCVRGMLPRDGEIGCALSHLKAYRMLLESQDDYCCVLEDDCQFEPNFKDQLKRIEEWIDPSRPQVVLMTNYSERNPPKTWCVMPSDGDTSAEGYVITRKAAETILKRNFPLCMPSDLWKFWAGRRLVELYHAFPTVIPCTWKQAGYVSDVCPPGEKLIRCSDMSVLRRLVWKVMRAIGLSLSKILV